MLVVGLGRAPAAARSRLTLLLAGAGLLLALVAVAGIVAQGAAAGGFSLREALHWDVVSAVLGTRFGTVWLVQAGLAVAVAALLLASRRVPVLALAALGPAALLLLTPSLSGHASVSGRIAFVTDVAHVTAAAVWVGGLAALVLALLWAGTERWGLPSAPCRVSQACRRRRLVAGRQRHDQRVPAGPRAPRPLGDDLRPALLAKIALVLPLLALGFYNNRSAVPRLRTGSPPRAKGPASAPRRRNSPCCAIVGVGGARLEPPARAEVAQPGRTQRSLSSATSVNPRRRSGSGGRNQIPFICQAPDSHRRRRAPSRRRSPTRESARCCAHTGPGHFIQRAQLCACRRLAASCRDSPRQFGSASVRVCPDQKEHQ